jgi:hypothetical protein
MTAATVKAIGGVESRASRRSRVLAEELMNEARQLVKQSRKLHRQLRELLDRQGPARANGKDDGGT